MKMDKEKYDLIIVENEPQYVLEIKKSQKDAIMVLHLHNDYLNVDTKLGKKIKENYDYIYANSKYIKNRVDEIQGTKTKVKVLYNGIDTQRFSAGYYDKRNERKKLGFSEQDFIFLYVGRVVPEKGVMELIEAFKKVKLTNKKLVIIGNSSDKKFYTKIIKMINEDIILKKFVDYADIPKYYAIADVGIIPSICNEAFGMVVVECLSMGKPVIISDRGALEEVTNKSCSKVAKYDKNYTTNICKAMQSYGKMNDEERKEQEYEAILNAKKFDKSIYIQNFLKLINEVENE